MAQQNTDLSGLPCYQATNHPSTSNANPVQNMPLPTDEREPLLPTTAGQHNGRCCSGLVQRISPIRRWCPFCGPVLLVVICMLIAAVIQWPISTSISGPAVQDRMRQEWEIAYADHSHRMDRMQEAWEVEVERHSQLRLENMAERKQWDAEGQARERVREAERMEEVQRQRRERQKEEEEERKKRAGIRWGELQKSDRCLRYGTRKYWSKLQVSEGYNALKGCRETEIEIHGRKLLPTYCDDQGTWGGVSGIWDVDFNEASCGTYWSDFLDEGCTAEGSGLRRIHGRLDNYNEADDWNDMCSSTPAKFNGLSFDAPIYCKNYGKGGVYGFWVIDDVACR